MAEKLLKGRAHTRMVPDKPSFITDGEFGAVLSSVLHHLGDILVCSQEREDQSGCSPAPVMELPPQQGTMPEVCSPSQCLAGSCVHTPALLAAPWEGATGTHVHMGWI